MNNDQAQQQIEDLQSRLAFQEDAIDQLNKTVADQQQSIEVLRQQLQYLHSQLQQLAEQQVGHGEPGSEIPPHY